MRRAQITVVLCLVLAPLPCFVAGAVTVRGKVVGADGASVPGATVFLSQDRRVRTEITGDNGQFRFDAVAIRVTELVAYKEGFALDGHTALPQGDLEIQLTLVAAATITVRVINNNFMPIPGARVRAMMVNDRFVVSAEDLSGAGFPVLRSDDAGVLDIPMLPEKGFIKLTLGHHRYADSNVAYLPVDTRRNDIILYEGARLRGRVTAEGEPIAEARVSLFQTGVSGQRSFAEAVTDPEGYYHLRAPEDTYMATAWHPRYASPPPVPVDMRRREEVAVANLELLPPYIIRGGIVLPDGAPCPGARVLFRKDNVIYDDTLTDGHGEFRLQVGSPDGVLRILPPPGYMTEILSDMPVSLGDVRDKRIEAVRLKALPVIRGRARFPAEEEPTRLYLRSVDLPMPIHDITAEDGSFEIRFFYQPDQKTLTFRLEHPLRFLRRDFTINVEEPGEVELLLEPFEPDQARRPPELGRNNLDALLGGDAPPVQCAEWFNSRPLTLDMLRGNVVVLTFWGGFDDSLFARNRMAELNALHALFREQGDVTVIGIHDASSDTDEIEEYLLEYGIAYPVGKDEDPFVSFDNYGINFIPQTVLIDKQGTVQYAQVEGRLFELVKALRRRP
ncbi:MAG TPA: redoxin domain-containing protein [Candidatus Hydrogenedentes bacterium]|nr:redoxin domain-containing protein [Candidatus Hydrogenedentota bacterium]